MWTDILAANLQDYGVHEETVVGIYLDKGINFTAAYIAILKAGEIGSIILGVGDKLITQSMPQNQCNYVIVTGKEWYFIM